MEHNDVDHYLKKRKLSPRERLPSMCRYKSKPCFNPRAFKRNGAPHNLCEEHRAQANNNQLRFELRRRLNAAHDDPDDQPLAATQRQSRVSRLASVARMASIFSREAAARKLAEEQRLDDDLDESTEPLNDNDVFGYGRMSDDSTNSSCNESFFCAPRFDNLPTAAVDSLEVEMEEEIDSWRQLAVQWRDNILDETPNEACSHGYQSISTASQMVWI